MAGKRLKRGSQRVRVSEFRRPWQKTQFTLVRGGPDNDWQPFVTLTPRFAAINTLTVPAKWQKSNWYRDTICTHGRLSTSLHIPNATHMVKYANSSGVRDSSGYFKRASRGRRRCKKGFSNSNRIEIGGRTTILVYRGCGGSIDMF